KRLSFETRAYAQADIQPRSLTAVADYWQRLGVGVEQNVVPNNLVADEPYRHTRTGFEILQSGAHFTHFHSSRVPLPANNFLGLNRSRYMSPELDALIDRYFAAIPWPERVEAAGRIAHHMTDQLVTMGLFYINSTVA